MKKIILTAMIFLMIITGCSSKKENDYKSDNENTILPNNNAVKTIVFDEEKTEDIQRIIDVFYYNPVVDAQTDYHFFDDNTKMLQFATYYKEEYQVKETPAQIAKILFGKNITPEEEINNENFSKYDYSEKGMYIPIIEGIYEEKDIIIVKAGLYSLSEELNSEKNMLVL